MTGRRDLAARRAGHTAAVADIAVVVATAAEAAASSEPAVEGRPAGVAARQSVAAAEWAAAEPVAAVAAAAGLGGVAALVEVAARPDPAAAGLAEVVTEVVLPGRAVPTGLVRPRPHLLTLAAPPTFPCRSTPGRTWTLGSSDVALARLARVRLAQVRVAQVHGRRRRRGCLSFSRNERTRAFVPVGPASPQPLQGPRPRLRPQAPGRLSRSRWQCRTWPKARRAGSERLRTTVSGLQDASLLTCSRHVPGG